MAYVQDKKDFCQEIQEGFEFLFSRFDFKVDSSDAEKAHGGGTPCLRMFCSSHSEGCEIRFMLEAAFSVSVRRLNDENRDDWFSLSLLLSALEDKRFNHFESPEKYDRGTSIDFYGKLFEQKAVDIFAALHAEESLADKYAAVEKQRSEAFFSKI